MYVGLGVYAWLVMEFCGWVGVVCFICCIGGWFASCFLLVFLLLCFGCLLSLLVAVWFILLDCCCLLGVGWVFRLNLVVLVIVAF